MDVEKENLEVTPDMSTKEKRRIYDRRHRLKKKASLNRTIPQSLRRRRRTKKEMSAIGQTERGKERAAYQHQYYLDHQEKAKTYQREYNLRYKKARGPTRGSSIPQYVRPACKDGFNASDLMGLPVEKAFRVIEAILKRRATFVGV